MQVNKTKELAFHFIKVLSVWQPKFSRACRDTPALVNLRGRYNPLVDVECIRLAISDICYRNSLAVPLVRSVKEKIRVFWLLFRIEMGLSVIKSHVDLLD